VTDADRARAIYELVVKGVVDLLRQKREGVAGSIQQEPYKGEFFRLFAAAFNGGLIENSGQVSYLSAEVLNVVVKARAPELVGNKRWNTLVMFWREWTYAWKGLDALRDVRIEAASDV
jgi:hypothetical protein